MKILLSLTWHDDTDWLALLTLNGEAVGEAETRGDRVVYNVPNAQHDVRLKRQARAAGEDSVPCYLNDLATAAMKESANA